MPPVLIHLHVPKCAGASVNTSLAEHFRGRVAAPSQPGSKARERYLALNNAQRDEQLDCVFGHLSYGEHNRFNRQCVYISAMRDPIERICSFFNFLHTRPDHRLHKYIKENLRDLNEFDETHLADEHFRRQWDNSFTRAYGGQKAVQAAVSGTFFAAPLEGIQEFLREIGAPEIPRRNVTDINRFNDYIPAYADKLSGRTLRALAPFCEDDYKIMQQLEVHCTSGVEFASNIGLAKSWI